MSLKGQQLQQLEVRNLYFFKNQSLNIIETYCCNVIETYCCSIIETYCCKCKCSSREIRLNAYLIWQGVLNWTSFYTYFHSIIGEAINWHNGVIRSHKSKQIPQRGQVLLTMRDLAPRPDNFATLCTFAGGRTLVRPFLRIQNMKIKWNFQCTDLPNKQWEISEMCQYFQKSFYWAHSRKYAYK